MLFSNVCWGFWLVAQAVFMPSYPSKLLFTALQCFLSAMQSFVVVIAVERNLAKWRLGWDMGLVAVVYCVSIYIW
ncbi:WAT1-related protein At5g64700 [Linum perenne]